MKTKSLVALIVLIALVAPALAAKPHKGGGKPPLQQKQQGPPAGPPSARLSWFFNTHLNGILAPLDQQGALPRNEVTQLREAFTDQYTKAPANEKPIYDAAVVVCNALWQAMDEREKAIASLQGSASVHGPSDLGATRKDDPSWVEYHRERHEERNRKRQAAQNDGFLTTQLKTQWTQRTLQLRQQINQLYAREREAERAAQQPAAAANAAPAANTITLDKPIQVKVKYGTATIPAGTTLPVVSRDANGVIVQYMGENVLLPP